MAKRQHLAGHKLFGGAGESGDWSKSTNRYIDKVLGGDPSVSFHSFRHVFRQSCGAAGLRTTYPTSCSVIGARKNGVKGPATAATLRGEARLVVANLKSPIALDHLV